VNESSTLEARVEARVETRLSGLYVHPIKSCAGIAVNDALLVETGLEFDRAWMVVDEHGDMLTQREHPRLALVQPTLRHHDMVLRAPGMLALHLRLDRVEAPARARVWDDIVKAYDMGALAAQWFSDFLGTKVQLVRFDPEQQRLSDTQWTGAVAAQNAFADGFPLLVAGAASLADLNQRLAARGQAPVGMERFRPNIVLDGLQPWDEDHIDELEIDTGDGGTVRLKLVKPCVRCTIPNVEPATGVATREPGDTLAGFRADPRMKGGLTFGMNAIPLSGTDLSLRPDQVVRIKWSF
jgi:uncharacterized protein YcbX